MVKRIEEKLSMDAAAKAQALKTVTYAVMHLVVAMAVAYALSGSWQVALGIGLLEPAVQTVAYTIHERAWKRREARRRAGADDSRDGEGGTPLSAGLPDRLSGDIRPAAG